MLEENSLKPLLEKLCALQEKQLTLLSGTVESNDLWKRQLLLYEQSQKAYDERMIRQDKEARIRATLTLIMLGLIAAAIFLR